MQRGHTDQNKTRQTELRTDQDLLDVTLTCEEGTQIEANKIVLSAGSFFSSEIY